MRERGGGEGGGGGEKEEEGLVELHSCFGLREFDLIYDYDLIFMIIVLTFVAIDRPTLPFAAGGGAATSASWKAEGRQQKCTDSYV